MRFSRRCAALPLLAACSLRALAALPTVATPAPAPASGGGLLQAAAGMLVVLGLIFLCAWLARRFGLPRLAGGQAVKVVASTAVGTRERVVVVEVADTWLVLGVTPSQVNALHTLPAQAAAPQPPSAAAAPGAAFAARLLQALERKGPHP